MKESTCSCGRKLTPAAALRQAFALSAKHAAAGGNHAIGLSRIRRIGNRPIAVRQAVLPEIVHAGRVDARYHHVCGGGRSGNGGCR